jgi:GR25 family glycosyltransferase involved in LPS biosynthesis
MLSEALRKYHDAVFVVTAPGFDDRQASATQELGEGNFEFIYGINKSTTSKTELAEQGLYDESRAIEIDRSSKPMTLGGVCCSIAHTNAYRYMLENDIGRALIFEDDVSVFPIPEDQIANILKSLPDDNQLVYWGWSGTARRPPLAAVKQGMYKLQHSIGVLKYNPTMIDNLYPSDLNEHFMVAGKHFGAYAYSVTNEAAKVLLEWNMPVVLNADNALMYAVLNGDLRGYVSRGKLFGEHSQGSPGPIESLVQT